MNYTSEKTKKEPTKYNFFYDALCINESTLNLVDISEYHLVPDEFKKNTIVLNSKKITPKDMFISGIKDIFENPLLTKFHSVLKRADKKVFNLKRSYQLNLMDIILEDKSRDSDSKFIWTLTNGLLNFSKRCSINGQRLTSTNELKLDINLLYIAVNDLFNGHITRDKFNGMIQKFKVSNLCSNSLDNKFIHIRSKKEFIKKDTGGVQHSFILNKKEKFTLKDFIYKCIIFSYSKPLCHDNTTMVNTIAQYNIAKYYQMSQSNVSQHIEGLLKVVKFQFVPKTAKEHYRIESNLSSKMPYIFTGGSGQYHKLEDNTLENLNFDVQVLGSKLFEQFEFGSYFLDKDNNYVYRKNKLFNTQRKKDELTKDGKRTIKKSNKGRVLQGLKYTDGKVNITKTDNLMHIVRRIHENNFFDYFDNQDPELKEAISMYSKDMQFQFSYSNPEVLKDKVKFLIRTVGMLLILHKYKAIGKDETFFIGQNHSIKKQLRMITAKVNRLLATKSKSKLQDKNDAYIVRDNFQKFVQAYKEIASKIKIRKVIEDKFLKEIESSLLYVGGERIQSSDESDSYIDYLINESSKYLESSLSYFSNVQEQDFSDESLQELSSYSTTSSTFSTLSHLVNSNNSFNFHYSFSS